MTRRSTRRVPLLLSLGGLAAVAALVGCGQGGTGPTPLIQDVLLKACIYSTACSVRPYPRVSNCVDAYYNLHVPFGLGPVYDTIYRCVVATAGDCDKVFGCYGSTRAAGRCDTTFQGRCDGARAISCDTLAGRVFVYDCATAGLSCLVKTKDAFEARCSTGGCDPATGRRCAGDRLLSCNDGAIEISDCAAQGLSCGAAASGSLTCLGSGAECQAGKFQPSCEGSVAVTCVGGKTARQDCAARPSNRRCESGACVRSGSECLDEFDRCQGATLQTCLDGKWLPYDCAALGLGPCAPAQNGAACAALN